jgi:hypothetical protein
VTTPAYYPHIRQSCALNLHFSYCLRKLGVHPPVVVRTLGAGSSYLLCRVRLDHSILDAFNQRNKVESVISVAPLFRLPVHLRFAVLEVAVHAFSR